MCLRRETIDLLLCRRKQPRMCFRWNPCQYVFKWGGRWEPPCHNGVTWLNFAAREGLDRCRQSPVSLKPSLTNPACGDVSPVAPMWLIFTMVKDTHWKSVVLWVGKCAEWCQKNFHQGKVENSHTHHGDWELLLNQTLWQQGTVLWARLWHSLALTFRWICMLHSVLSKRRDFEFQMQILAWKGSLR